MQKSGVQSCSPAFSFLNFICLIAAGLVIVEASSSGGQREKRNSTDIKRYWDPEEIQLTDFASQCLVLENKSEKCLLTVEAFNQLALIYVPKRSANDNLDSARQKIVDEFLHAHFWATKAKMQDKGSTAKIEKEIAGKCSLMVKDLEEFREHGYKHVSIPDSNLKEMYQALYDSLFASRWIPMGEFIGSSDSAYIDSVWKVLSGIRQNTTKKSRKKSTLPWQKKEHGVLPLELFQIPESTSTAGSFHLSKNNFGYFILYLNKFVEKSEISFEEARGTLSEKWLRENIPASEVKKFYEINKEQFKTPDTLRISFWLKPKTNNSIGHKTIMKDTLLKPITLYDYELPEEIRTMLLASFDTASFEGTSKTWLGLSRIKILKREKSGIQLNLSQVEEQIRRSMASKPRSLKTISSDRIRPFFEDQVFADSYLARSFELQPKLTSSELSEIGDDEMVQKVIKNKSISDEHKDESLKSLYLHIRNLNEINEWKKELNIRPFE